MVHVRAKKKGAKDSGLPNYDHKSWLISVVVHTGGTFRESPSTEYVGGKIVYLDWCNVDQVRVGHNSLTCGKKSYETESTSREPNRAVEQDVGGSDVGGSDAGVADVGGADVEITMAPPQYRPFEDIASQSEDVGTQQSQLSVEVPTQPLMAGPTMHQQLQMAKKRRVHS